MIDQNPVALALLGEGFFLVDQEPLHMPSDFFFMHANKMHSAPGWIVPNQGHDCFNAIVHAAGGLGELMAMASSRQYTDEVLHQFCMNCGMSRSLYDPLDPYGKNPYLDWKIKFISEFIDWYKSMFLNTLKSDAEFVEQEEPEQLERQGEAVKRKRGRPRKEALNQEQL